MTWAFHYVTFMRRKLDNKKKMKPIMNSKNIKNNVGILNDSASINNVCRNVGMNNNSCA